MRTAETVLNVIQDRGKRQLPLEDIYRQLYNPNLYLTAYAKLYNNDGALTPGTTPETADGMSLSRIDNIIEQLRYERYRWTPVRRTYIEKKNGSKKRPLGLPTWTDKLLQEVIRLILEAYYEPQFNSMSHGFRPNRGCHTALQEIERTWKGTKWFIEGDISGCFDAIDHNILISILSEKLHDNRFLRLIRNLLRAGYLENWKYHTTMSGTPQGGVCSPVLANIYLNKLDMYVEQHLIPTHTKGIARCPNTEYRKLLQKSRTQQKHGNREQARKLRKQAQSLPSLDPEDPNYSRLRYIRYADDILLGFAGPKAEAEEIKRKIANFLQDELSLKLSQEKTLITHATTEKAHFLGYAIHTQQANDRLSEDRGRRINGRIALKVPKGTVDRYCTTYMQRGKPIHRPELIFESDYAITKIFQSEYRGVVQYYMLAQNVSSFWKLHWIMQSSLLKTLANKHKASVRTMIRKYRINLEKPEGTYKCLQVEIKRGDDKPPLTTYFGGIPLRRHQEAILLDKNPQQNRWISHNELIKRLIAQECELCGSKENIEVHHIQKLANLKNKGQREKPRWMQVMASRRRKTLIVCKDCHTNIHAGRPTRQRSTI